MIRVDGKVRAPARGTINPDLPTGEIEVFASEIEVLSAAKELPLPVFGEPDYPEDLRLQYRFLDLRRETLHAQHHAARRDHRLDPQAHERGRLLRVLRRRS